MILVLRKYQRVKAIWGKVFKYITSNFLKAVLYKFYLDNSWTLCPIYSLSEICGLYWSGNFKAINATNKSV